VANSETRVANNAPAFARPLAEKAELAAYALLKDYVDRELALMDLSASALDGVLIFASAKWPNSSTTCPPVPSWPSLTAWKPPAAPCPI